MTTRYIPESIVLNLVSTDMTPSVTVGWTAISHPGTYTARTYDVYRGLGTRTRPTECTFLGTTASLTYRDTGVIINATYTYFVIARMGGDTIDFLSNPLTTTVPLGLRWVYAFKVDTSNQLRVIDMLDPTLPTFTTPTISGVSNQAIFQGLVDDENIYLGLADKIYILRWVDTPATPALLGSIAWTFPGTFIVEKIGSHKYLYASDTDGGTNCGASSWEVTDPTAIVSLGNSRSAAGIANLLNPVRSMVMDPSRNIWISWTSATQGARWSKTPVSTAGALSATAISTINTAVGSNGVYSEIIEDSILWNWSQAFTSLAGYPLPPAAPLTYGSPTVIKQPPWLYVRGANVFNANSPAQTTVNPVNISDFTNPSSISVLTSLGSANQAAPGLAACGNQLAYYNNTDGKFYCYDSTNLSSLILKNTGGTSMALGGPTYLMAYMPDFIDGRNGLIVT